MNNNPWIKNTGTVPDGVGPDTLIEVEYHNGEVVTWCVLGDNNKPSYWEILDSEFDVIRWRFV